MKMDIIAGSQNDEYYTPEYAITPLLKYLKPESQIWCPFDTQDSWFTKTLICNGFKVTPTHISQGYNFFDVYKRLSEVCDYIISNPPYSKKEDVLKTLFSIKKPFAMLVGVVGLFESKNRFNMFKNNKFEIMYFNKRIKYYKSYKELKPSSNPPYSSIYICSNVLPKQIIFEELK